MSNVDYIEGWTWHGRKGDLENAFRYSVDYVLFDATHEISGPALFSRNGAGAFSVHDKDHGGKRNRPFFVNFDQVFGDAGAVVTGIPLKLNKLRIVADRAVSGAVGDLFLKVGIVENI